MRNLVGRIKSRNRISKRRRRRRAGYSTGSITLREASAWNRLSVRNLISRYTRNTLSLIQRDLRLCLLTTTNNVWRWILLRLLVWRIVFFARSKRATFWEAWANNARHLAFIFFFVFLFALFNIIVAFFLYQDRLVIIFLILDYVWFELLRPQVFFDLLKLVFKLA